jgi:hypothetical protein
MRWCVRCTARAAIALMGVAPAAASRIPASAAVITPSNFKVRLTAIGPAAAVGLPLSILDKL